MKVRLQMAALATAVALAAVPSFAQPIALSITGDTQVNGTQILFNSSYGGGGSWASPGNFGQFSVAAPVQSIFAANGVVPTELGGIMSLDSSVEGVGTPLVPPVLFMTFSGLLPGNVPTSPGGTNLDLYLTELQQGTFAPGSPFFFTQTNNGINASFNVLGYVLNTSTNTKTSFAGTFEATFTGLTLADLEAGPTITGFSGTFDLTLVPEPASLLLIGAGLLGFGLVARHRKRA